MKFLFRAVFGLLVILILLEVVARLCGVTDFPLYEISSEYGYVPVANQEGAFLRHNHWIFNARHMATGPYQPGKGTNIVLLGDSIVLGGNPVDQASRLGSRLEAFGQGRWSVWPVGAASWSNLNEIAWLQKNPDVVKDSQWVVWEINSGDFYEFSHWVNEDMQPRHRPWSALYYALHKYLWESRLAEKYIYWLKNPQDSEVYNTNMVKTFPSFVEFLPTTKVQYPKAHFLILWYPAKVELGGQAPGWQKVSQMMAQICRENQVDWIDLSQEPTWNASLYRDHMHPNGDGNQVLAKIVAKKIQELAQDQPVEK